MDDAFSLLTPTSPAEGGLYRARLDIFFNNSRGSAASSVVGGAIVAAVLLEYRAPVVATGLWLSLLLASSLLLHFTTGLYRENLSLRALRRLLYYRFAAGLLVGAHFGAAPFLLPAGAPEGAVITISLVLLVLFGMTLLTYYTAPVYYTLIDVVVVGPLMIYLVVLSTHTSVLFITVVAAAQFVLLPKGFQVSRIAIERLRLATTLATEVRRHEKAREQIKYLALHDTLTGVANRRLFEELWRQSEKLARRERKKIGLLFVDLDDFKPINDRFGHDVGDQVLQAVARRLVSGVREVDLVSRYGGDEFYILLEDIASAEAMGMLADKLDARLAAPVSLHGRKLVVTASIGCALFPDDGNGLEEILKIADRRMYAVKKIHKATTRAIAGSES